MNIDIEEIIKTKYSDKTEYTKNFIRQAIERYGDVYDYYKTNRVDNNLTKVIVTCRVHGDFEIDPSYFLKSKYCKGCPQCNPGRTTKVTLERFSAKLSEIFPYYSLTPNSQYVNNSTNIELLCTKHNEIFKTRPDNILLGKCGCPTCIRENKSNKLKEAGRKEFEEWFSLHFPNYTLVSEYQGSTSPVLLRCNYDGTEFPCTVNYLRQIIRTGSNSDICPCCRKEKSSLEKKQSFINAVTGKFGDRYDFSQMNFTDRKDLVSGVVCKICREEVSPTLPDNFIKRGKGCGCYHTKPRGEVEIGKWLQENNIEYTEQYRVEEDLSILNGRTDHSRVIVDFRLFLGDKEYWIECNGEQHYTWIKLMHTREEFDNQLRRDRNVREYCLKKGITLIEIPIHKIGTGVKLYELLKSIFIDHSPIEIPIPEISYTRLKSHE